MYETEQSERRGEGGGTASSKFINNETTRCGERVMVMLDSERERKEERNSVFDDWRWYCEYLGGIGKGGEGNGFKRKGDGKDGKSGNWRLEI